MPDPVVHFEIIGTDPERLREYYSALFGWSFTTPSPVASAVSDPIQYGFVELVEADDGSGIRGGVGGGASFHSHAVFYVGVSDVAGALARAVELGGSRVFGPDTSPNGLVVAQFRDPEGAVIGLAGAA
jgi:predicted enzyme related to lactoylglutathione lyase